MTAKSQVCKITEDVQLRICEDKVLASFHPIVLIGPSGSGKTGKNQAKAKAREAEIDQLVYKLYDLTQEEIKTVESAS